MSHAQGRHLEKLRSFVGFGLYRGGQKSRGSAVPATWSAVVSVGGPVLPSGPGAPAHKPRQRLILAPHSGSFGSNSVSLWSGRGEPQRSPLRRILLACQRSGWVSPALAPSDPPRAREKPPVLFQVPALCVCVHPRGTHEYRGLLTVRQSILLKAQCPQRIFSLFVLIIVKIFLELLIAVHPFLSIFYTQTLCWFPIHHIF